jgi:type I restriction enzyme S subunit
MPQNIGDNRVIETDVARIRPEDAQRLARYRVSVGDIVYSRRGDVERRALIRQHEHGWLCGTGCLRVRFGDGAVNPQYASYYLGDPRVREWVVRHAHGATMPNLNTALLSALPFVVPPLDTQRAIARILGALDDKIELSRRMNETLAATARALFKSLFSDFDPVRAKAEGRDTGMPAHLADQFPDSLEASELGEIPRGWGVVNLGSIAEVIDCLHAKKPERRSSGLPLLQLWNIRDDGLVDMTDSYLIDEDAYAHWVSRMEAHPGDCVVTNVGRVGAVSQVPEGLRAALGRNMTGVRCRPEFNAPTFLIECLLSDAMQAEMTSKVDSGTILDALNVRSIPRLRLVAPPRELVSAFESVSRPLRAHMEVLLRQSRTLSALRDALLPKLMAGELRVPVAEPGSSPASAHGVARPA